MRKLFSSLFFLPFALSAVLFDGTFNSMTSSSDFDKWNFNTKQGEWQTYICGAGVNSCIGSFSQYATLDPTYRNYADGSVKQGCRLKINSTSTWSGPMLRTEIIPNGWEVDSTKIQYFHFSMKQSTDNQIDGGAEHQLVFFEQHFADIKYGGNGGDKLWFWLDVQGTDGNVWSSTFTADTWFNFIVMVDYPGNKVALYHSKNGDPLVQVVPSTTVQARKADWHLGNLRLAQGTYPAGSEQVLFYSGIRVTDDLSLTSFSTGSPTPPPAPGSPPTTPTTPTPNTPTPNTPTPTTPTPTTPTPNTPTTPNTPAVPSNCQIGEQNCPCTQGGACNPGLSCINSYCTDVSSIVEPAPKSGSQMNGTIAACIAIIVIAVVVVAVVLLALFIKIKFSKS